MVGLILVIGVGLDKQQERAYYFIMPMYVWLGGFFFLPSFLGGLGVLQGKRWGRILLTIVSVELLFAIPVGTVLGGIGLWALVTGDPPPPQYSQSQAPPHRTPAQRNYSPPAPPPLEIARHPREEVPPPMGPLLLLADRSLSPPIQITAIASSPTGNLAAVAAGMHQQSPELVIWDTNSLQPVQRIPVTCVTRSLAWTHDERLLITARGVPWDGGPGSPGDCIFVWDRATARELLRFGSDLFGIRSLAVSPNGNRILTAGMKGTTHADGSCLDLWDTASGNRVARLSNLEGDSYSSLPFFTSVAFTPDGTLAIAGCDHYTIPNQQQSALHAPWGWKRGVRVFRLADGNELDLFRTEMRVTFLSVSNTGRWLLVSGERFGLWDLDTGIARWEKPNPAMQPCAATSDCRYLARAEGARVDNHGPYENTAVELYDGFSGELLTRGQHRTSVLAMAFPGVKTIIAGGDEGDLRFWKIPI